MTDLMGQTGSSGKARCAARCGASGKRCNAAGGPVWPIGDRVFRHSGQRCASLLMLGITALGAPCRNAGKPGEMSHYCRPLVLWVTQFTFGDCRETGRKPRDRNKNSQEFKGRAWPTVPTPALTGSGSKGRRAGATHAPHRPLSSLSELPWLRGEGLTERTTTVKSQSEWREGRRPLDKLIFDNMLSLRQHEIN